MERQAMPALAALPSLETLMDAAWPSPDREEASGWVLRASDGVTQRANSIWPRSEPDGTNHSRLASLREARAWYRSRRLPVIFQVFDDPRSAALNAVLDEEGFTRQSETLVLVRDAGGASASRDTAPRDTGVELSAEPSDEWLRLWWSVDGRGGDDSLATARSILRGCQSLYALVCDDDGVPAAVGRLALPSGGAGGLYCMATHRENRRHGYATRVLQSLLREGDARGLGSYWLLVTAANAGARELYSKAGFTEAGRYYYRQERPKRHLTGC
ncbi:GNAT family N-acetyltransferase [Arthrobacter sp. B10-11]|uniref:GNAT family N-acetyltransferase n=1 Tax=Arthrobacter sp. B10-11 TaxID=3081160 RepID=UPI00295346E8|nr:GNAT family N-acetyltransferase [Arthrobacter sp. B10-11]MDV8148389.1 GNAT family N-acetyltransferase [Arthrobacter sp. B10-11]